MASRRRPALVPVGHISRSILVLRGQRIILESDLAAIYGWTTGRLNEAVQRYAERFPEDFMFRLSAASTPCCYRNLRYQHTCPGWPPPAPWAFTEHGAIQVANVLDSPRAVAMGVYVVRAFVKLREQKS